MKLRTVLYGVILAIFPLAAFSTDVCVPEPEDSCPAIPADRFCMTARTDSCGTGYVAKVRSYTEAPPVEGVEAVCDFAAGRYTCQAWGKGRDVSYTWSVGGNASFVTPPFSSGTAQINCTPSMFNKVHLTVTSKFGRSTTVTTPLYCGYLGEY